MYLKGYRILTSGELRGNITFRKWDFGGDKPWTNSSWNSTLNSIKALDESEYPLIISDLDDAEAPTIEVKDRSAFDLWMKEGYK